MTRRSTICRSVMAIGAMGALVACASDGGGGGAGGSAGSSSGGGAGAGGSGGNTGGVSAGSGGGGSGGASGGSAGSIGGSGGGGTSGAAGGGSGGGGAAGGSVGGASAGASGSGGAGGGSTGAGGFGIGGPSRCAGANVLFCESFENGLDAAVWTTNRGGDGTVAVDEGHAARGTKALHVRTANGSGRAFVTEKKGLPAAGNVLYGRMFVWFEDALTTDGHFTLAEGAGSGTPAWIRFGGQFKKYGVGTDLGPSCDWTDVDDKLIPTKTWTCMEFLFKGDSHEFRVWWDDVERPRLHSGPSRHANFTMPTFSSLWFGWWMYNAQEPQELWIDEIAVDTKPIGCAK